MEDDLLARSRNGDRAAFDSLVAPHRERILRYLVTMVGDVSQAEDLVQEAIRRTFENLAGFEGRARFSTWLYRIAVNLARNHLRDAENRARPQDPETLDRAAGGGRGSVLSSIVGRETVELLALAVERLPLSLREAFALHCVEHLPYEEIAAATGLTSDALHIRVHRAKSLLRDQIGDLVDTFWSE